MSAKISTLLALLAAFSAVASAADVQTGRVFADGNGNGRLDAGEAGIAGVALSNGSDIVRSDAEGRYSLRIAPGQTAFVIKPAGWRVALGGSGLPRFWRHHQPVAGPPLKHGGIPATGSLPSSVDFALNREPAGEAGLDVLLIADPQTGSHEEVDYYRRDIVESMRRHRSIALGLTLGDIADDDLSLYPQLDAATAKLGVPWLHAAGNHDLDFDASRDEDSLLSFRHNYGPDSFAWEEREAVFVVLDDVVYRPGELPAYVGGLREDQFVFLANYLSTVPKDRLLVLAMHIPVFDSAPEGRPETFRSADRARLFALLREFPRVLVLSGHRHTQRHHFHDAASGWKGDEPLHEYNVGAASGAFWSGVADAAGIPDATMADGTPNGYARLQVARDGEYRLSWHPARLPQDDPAFTEAMALHAPRMLRRGAYEAWGVYANVFMGHDGTRVEYRIDDGDWTPMTQVLRPDPRLLAENVRDDFADALRGYDRSPEAESTAHLWRGTLPTDLAAGEHAIEVRAFDSWQGEQRAGTRYRLESAER